MTTAKSKDEIAKMPLADLGRFIASRTGDVEAAKIARSTAPQIRYDAIVSDMIRDPARRIDFTAEELHALVDRISAPLRRKAARGFINMVGR